MDDLRTANEITNELYQELSDSIWELKESINDCPPVICHGDCSNKNIMIYNGKMVCIDYEDAFWGIADYDFLYWLTFMSQRKYYQKGLLKELDLAVGAHVARLLMQMIVVLKCFQAYATGSYKGNHLSTTERIEELKELE